MNVHQNTLRLSTTPPGSGAGIIPDACHIYLCVLEGCARNYFKVYGNFCHASLQGCIQFPSFPSYTVSKHQLLAAMPFPDVLASLELQLPHPSLPTSSLNIEHNEQAFFKQTFYTAPLKGTISTKSKRTMCVLYIYSLRKEGLKLSFSI